MKYIKLCSTRGPKEFLKNCLLCSLLQLFMTPRWKFSDHLVHWIFHFLWLLGTRNARLDVHGKNVSTPNAGLRARPQPKPNHLPAPVLPPILKKWKVQAMPKPWEAGTVTTAPRRREDNAVRNGCAWCAESLSMGGPLKGCFRASIQTLVYVHIRTFLWFIFDDVRQYASTTDVRAHRVK